MARVAGLLAIAAVGIAAWNAFDRDLDRRLSSPGFSAAARAMPAEERRKLGAAQAPSGLEAAERGRVQQAIALSLGSSFRVVMGVAAALALLAAATGARAAAGRNRPRVVRARREFVLSRIAGERRGAYRRSVPVSTRSGGAMRSPAP